MGLAEAWNGDEAREVPKLAAFVVKLDKSIMLHVYRSLSGARASSSPKVVCMARSMFVMNLYIP